MAEIIRLEDHQDRRPRIQLDAPSVPEEERSADVLFFTGVRYERMANSGKLSLPSQRLPKVSR